MRLYRRQDTVEGTLANEMVPLQEINECNTQHFLFDGVIDHLGKRSYLQGVPFELLSIGGYEDLNTSTVGSNVWIQSIQGKKCDVWYRVCLPSQEYYRYHKVFLWIADLAKHVIDFLHNHDAVNLQCFEYSFYDWLQQRVSEQGIITPWLEEYG